MEKFVSERLKIGSTACDVLEEIVALHPLINAVNLIFYIPHLNSTDGVFAENRNVWLPRKLINRNNLKEISEANFKASNKEIMMAVSSEVMLEGRNFAHVPMIDFSCDINLEEIVPKVNSIPGVILKSGESFHYWGTSLVTRESWADMVDIRLRAEDSRKAHHQGVIYDSGFFEASLERNYSALRLFGYAGTNKETEPSAVALIK